MLYHTVRHYSVSNSSERSTQWQIFLFHLAERFQTSRRKFNLHGPLSDPIPVTKYETMLCGTFLKFQYFPLLFKGSDVSVSLYLNVQNTSADRRQ